MKKNFINTTCIGIFFILSFLAPMERVLAQTTSGDAYKLRTIYMIPSNRSPQPGAEQKLQNFVLRMQDWYSDHMELLGYGPKTFLFEAEQDGVTPKVNIVNVPEPDTYFHGDRGQQWVRTRDELSKAGYPPGQDGELLFVIAEIQIQLSNGSFLGHFVGGSGSSFEGMGMITGDHLGRLSEIYLTDNRRYDGLILPELGPYPLVFGVSFHSFENPSLSSISSSAYGAAVHEVGHGFGLWHDSRNDRNFNGILMGNGLRGFRGAIFPHLYPNENTRLSSASGLLLNYSRFFNPNQTFNDNTAPQATITSSGTVVPQDGLCQLDFTASDTDSSLAGVMLIRNGNLVADMPLTGNQVTSTISTDDYVRGTENIWHLIVLDEQGNRSYSSSVNVTCAAGFNQAPKPYIEVSKSKIEVGEEVTLYAGRSIDNDGDASLLKVEWDLDGDGSFDTLATTTKTHNAVYTQAGIYQIIARLTDPQGDSSLSMPIGISVESKSSVIVIEKLINHSARQTPDTAAQLLAGSRYRVEYKVTNNSSNRLNFVQVYEGGQLVCNLYALDPGQSKQPYRCASNEIVLAGNNNLPATVTAKVAHSNQELISHTNAYYDGLSNLPGELTVTHYVNNENANTKAKAVTVNGNEAEALFRVENTGNIELYRVKTYHDPASPVNSGWQQQCFFGTLEPGQVRYCKRTLNVTHAGLNKAFGRVQGKSANVSATGVVNASNPTYFNVVLP